VGNRSRADRRGGWQQGGIGALAKAGGRKKITKVLSRVQSVGDTSQGLAEADTAIVRRLSAPMQRLWQRSMTKAATSQLAYREDEEKERERERESERESTNRWNHLETACIHNTTLGHL